MEGISTKNRQDYAIERTKITADDLQQIREKKKDTYFTAENAIDRGIADEIIGMACDDEGK